MISLNPGSGYFGRWYNDKEAREVHQKLIETMPTDSDWSWYDTHGNAWVWGSTSKKRRRLER